METREGKYAVREGSVILLRPNMWHRYRPLKETGWMEHYLDLWVRWLTNDQINSLLNDSPVLQIGYQEESCRISNK